MKLEQITKGALITGIEPGKVVRVVSADPLGDNAVIRIVLSRPEMRSPISCLWSRWGAKCDDASFEAPP